MSISLFRSELPKTLSNEEFLEYLHDMRNGDLDAEEKLIMHNLRLIADQIYSKFYDVDDKEELFSVGIEGLIKAIKSFDETKGNRFSTYAVICINNEINMFLRLLRKRRREESYDQSIDSDSDTKWLDTLEDPLANFRDLYELEQEELILEIRRQVEMLDDRT